MLAAPGTMCGYGARPPRRWENPLPLRGRHLPRGIITGSAGGSPEPSRQWGACVLGGLRDAGALRSPAGHGVGGTGTGVAGLGELAEAQGPCRGTGTLPECPLREAAGAGPAPRAASALPAAMAGPRRLQATARPQGGRHGGTPRWAGPGRCAPHAASHSRSVPPRFHSHVPLPAPPFPPPQIFCPFKASGRAF